MSSGQRRVFFSVILGMTASVIFGARTLADEPPREVASTWKCTISVVCKIVIGGPSTSTPVEGIGASPGEAEAKANAAADKWASDNCKNIPRFIIEGTEEIPEVLRSQSNSNPGAWVVTYDCTTRTGATVVATRSGCTYCEALTKARDAVCPLANLLGGACCCSTCIEQRPCCSSGRCRRCR